MSQILKQLAALGVLSTRIQTIAALVVLGLAAESRADVQQPITFDLKLYNPTETDVKTIKVTTRDVIKNLAGSNVKGGKLWLILPDNPTPAESNGNISATLRVTDSQGLTIADSTSDTFNLYQVLSSQGGTKTYALSQFSLAFGSLRAELFGTTRWTKSPKSPAGKGSFRVIISGACGIEGLSDGPVPCAGLITGGATEPSINPPINNSTNITSTNPPPSEYTPTTNGLIARWRGDGNANDSWGGHNGTLQGTGFGPGKFDQAFVGGSFKRVFVPDSADFQLTSFTVATWINVSANSWEVFFRGDNRVQNDPYSLAMDNNGNIGIGIQSASETDSVYAPVSFHQWHQVTATLDGSSHQLSLYIDGSLVGQKTTTVVPLLALDPYQVPGLGIGNVQDGYDLPFLGSIDEVLLYDHALTPDELQTVFQ